MSEAVPPVSGLHAVAALITTVGFPVVVAGVCVWFLLTRVATALTAIQAQEDLRTQKVAEMQAALIATLETNATRFEAALARVITANRELAERYGAPGRK